VVQNEVSVRNTMARNTTERLAVVLWCVLCGTVFGADAGFYLFKLPFYEAVYSYLIGLVFITLVMTVITHFLDGAINLTVSGERFAPHVKGHISTLLGIIFLLEAWKYKLETYNLMYSPRGAAYGASYTDVNAQLPALNILIVVAIFCAGLFFVNVYFRGWKFPADLLQGQSLPLAIINIEKTGLHLDRQTVWTGNDFELKVLNDTSHLQTAD